MEMPAVYQISLIAAYIAGMVALFAPCCISYLFPAYLGNIFKERRQILFMTFVYSLGIFVVMIPVVLGAKALQMLFFQLHDQTYLVGGVFMLLVAGISFLGIKLPMPHIILRQRGQRGDVASNFILGIFSGITSACCAPVLVGVMALSSLTPSTLQALGVGAFYVLGMVTPLYLASLFIDKKNILEKPILKKVIYQVKLGGRTYPIFVANIIASLIFAVTGVLMIWLTSTGRLGMTIAESAVTKTINQVATAATDRLGSIPGLDLIFAALGIYLMYKFIKNIFKNNRRKETMKQTAVYTCPMHPEITSDKPGKCPKCGGMPLVASSSKEAMRGKDLGSKGHMDHSMHDHASMMASPEAAGDFLKRFWTVTALLFPLLLLTKTGLNVLGIADFGFRPYLQFGFATAIFYFALVFFQHARHEIAMGKYGMMTLVSLAVGAGYLFSAASTFLPSLEVEFYLEISTLIWVLLFGHYLEARSSSAAGDALQEVAKLLPKQAHLLKDGKTIEVELSKLAEEDVVLIKPGEKVPADGIIIRGKANMDEALISGESKPVEKDQNDKVIAGSICLDGSLEVKLERVGESSTIGQIQKLIAEAQKTKPTAQKIADKAASALTFSALGVGLIALLFWTLIAGETLAFALTLAITVLVIACPHALGLAIPTVSTIATTLATKNGVFLKDLSKLEVIKRIDYVMFDKTGTLTKGEFGITEILPEISKFQDTRDKKIPNSNIQSSALSKEQEEILQIAASLERQSSHVIGLSIVDYAKEQKKQLSQVDKFKNIAGKGIYGEVRSMGYYIGNRVLMEDNKLYSKEEEKVYKELSQEGKTVVFLADKKKVLGILALSDQIKNESYSAVRNLHRLGVKVAMLTGDNEKVAQSVAKDLKIDTYFAEVRPEDKYKHIQKLQREGNKVMMVGDGVNDAPALTQADVGVAIGAGTDVAVEAGDVVLTRNNPEDIARLVILSRKVYRKMVENLVWATGYNVLAIPAAAGVFAPWGFFLRPEIGALLMAGSSVIVVINAMLLKKLNLKLD